MRGTVKQVAWAVQIVAQRQAQIDAAIARELSRPEAGLTVRDNAIAILREVRDAIATIDDAKTLIDTREPSRPVRHILIRAGLTDLATRWSARPDGVTI